MTKEIDMAEDRGAAGAPDWPRDPKNGRLLCAPERPMPRGAEGRWSHSDVQETGECSDGCCAYYRCVSCGASWRQELPQ